MRHIFASLLFMAGSFEPLVARERYARRENRRVGEMPHCILLRVQEFSGHEVDRQVDDQSTQRRLHAGGEYRTVCRGARDNDLLDAAVL